MRIRSTIAAIEEGLRAAGTAERAAGEQRYLKSDLQFLGVAVPQIRTQARRWLRSQADDLKPEDLRRLVRALWRRRVHELRSFGIELLTLRRDRLTVEDLELVEWILGRANTWAHVDPVAVQIAGPLVDRFPSRASVLDQWVVDENFWLRRAALLAHLLPLRRGAGDWERFVRYATRMLEDKEFFIRKAIGWVLRETGKVTPQRVVEFLAVNMGQVSGLTLREGVKHLAPEDRDPLLEAYRHR